MHGTRDVYGTNRARFREQCRRPAPEITRIEGGKQERRLYRPWSDAREARSTNKEREERKRDEEKGHAEESASYENESERTHSRGFYIARMQICTLQVRDSPSRLLTGRWEWERDRDREQFRVRARNEEEDGRGGRDAREDDVEANRNVANSRRIAETRRKRLEENLEIGNNDITTRLHDVFFFFFMKRDTKNSRRNVEGDCPEIFASRYVGSKERVRKEEGHCRT